MVSAASTSVSTQTALPPVVSREEWETSRDALLVKEKAHMRAGDALAAERRRLPMVEITKPYMFDGPAGSRSLLDLFDGRSQLIVYHFMFDPTWDEGCVGCSMLMDNLGHPAHLHARDTSRVLISRAPRATFTPFKERMGWTEPWYSSFGTEFNVDFEATVDGEEHHGISVFLRDGDQVFQTYHTSNRGGEMVLNTFHYLDLTPLGRQESGEDSPPGWPQGPLYEWWRHHDRYEGISPSEPASESCSCCH